MNKKLGRKGSGRTEGATSNVRVKLSVLNEYFKHQSGIEVPVARRWAKELGIPGVAVEGTTANIRELATPPIDMKVVKFH
jgi:hypothetical protein